MNFLDTSLGNVLKQAFREIYNFFLNEFHKSLYLNDNTRKIHFIT